MTKTTTKDGMKFCAMCGQVFPATKDYFHVRNSLGRLNSYCKPCARSKATKHHQANREDKLIKFAEYRRRNAQKLAAYQKEHRDKDKQKAYNKAYHATNVVRIKKQKRLYYLRHKAYVLECSRKWEKSHPEKMEEHNRKKRFRRRGVPLTPEAIKYVELIKLDPCVYCGSREKMHIDHIVPISKGGNSDWDNLAPCCAKCNYAKSNKNIIHYLLQRKEDERDCITE